MGSIGSLSLGTETLIAPWLFENLTDMTPAIDTRRRGKGYLDLEDDLLGAFP